MALPPPRTRAAPDVKVIAVADAADDRSVDAAFASGASAFCSKAADPEDFAAAVRQSFHHSIYLAYVAGVPAAIVPLPSRCRRTATAGS